MLLTHAVSTQTLLVRGTLQISVTDWQTHRVTAGVAWRAVAIAGHRHTYALLARISGEALRAMALFHMAQHTALGILATSLWLQTGIEALSALADFTWTTLGVQQTGSCMRMKTRIS